MSKIILILIIVVALAIYGVWFYLFSPHWRVGPGAEPLVYTNTQYGFQITLPNSWKGYTVENQTWKGNEVSNSDMQYSGPLVVIKNPQTTAKAKYQDISIMVFSPDVWQGVLQERIAVSAAPIPPAEVGQNTKYVFATPPRWYGFTDAQGWQEAVDAVKTFKSF
jgi:hypothetical protein